MRKKEDKSNHRRVFRKEGAPILFILFLTERENGSPYPSRRR